MKILSLQQCSRTLVKQHCWFNLLHIFFERVHFKIYFNHTKKLKYQYEGPLGMKCEYQEPAHPEYAHQDKLVCEWIPELFDWEMHQTSFCFIAYDTVWKLIYGF